MKIFNEDEIVVGADYFVVCDDGVVRFLTAEVSDIQHGGYKLTEFVFYDIHGTEKYRTYSPHLIYKLGE